MQTERHAMNKEIRKMDMESKDLVVERIEQMKAMFPEIVTESAGGGSFLKQSTSKSYGSFWATR